MLSLISRKKKWFIGCSYNPSKDIINDHISYLVKCLDYYSPFHDNILLLGDLNFEISETCMKEFCEA